MQRPPGSVNFAARPHGGDKDRLVVAHLDTAPGAPVSDPASACFIPETRRIGDRRSEMPVESGAVSRCARLVGALNFGLGTFGLAPEIPPSPAVAENQPGPWTPRVSFRGACRKKNRMNESSIFESHAARLREFIRRHCPAHRPAPADDGEFTELALDLFGLHYAHNPAYRALCHARKRLPLDVADWREIPAVPAAAFKSMEMTVLCPDERTGEFHSSGTTDDEPSRHFHCAASLAIYEDSLLPWFQAHVLPEGQQGGARFAFVALTPPPTQAPHSSLAHMFDTVRRRFAPDQSVFTGEPGPEDGWKVNHEETLRRLREAASRGQAVVLLGTAFNFVHLLDRMTDEGATLHLPRGSRVMETGGYKGRSRELPRPDLHALITARLGIACEFIVCEYGMSELSSQAYDCVAGPTQSPKLENRTLRFPPWARAQIISPETGREVSDGEAGLVRVFDLANVASAVAVQTEDLAVRHSDGFELLGRSTDVEPRGCSLMSI